MKSEFLRAIERTAPEAVEDLVLTALPAFRRILEGAGIDSKDFCEGAGWDFVFKEMETVIRAWCFRFGLVRDPGRTLFQASSRPPGSWPEVPKYPRPGSPSSSSDFGFWLLWATISTLAKLSSDPAVQRPILFDLSMVRNFGGVSWAKYQDLQFVLPAWDPFSETEKAFSQRAKTSFDEALSNYVTRYVTLFARPIEVPTYVDPNGVTTFSRCAPRVFSPLHFDWLVMYQIRVMRWTEIAAMARSTNNWRTIKAGAHQAAEAILGEQYKRWLRVSSPGRPKKT